MQLQTEDRKGETCETLIAATTALCSSTYITFSRLPSSSKKGGQIRCRAQLTVDNSEPEIQRNERKLQAEDRVHCMSTSPFGLELEPEIQWNERKQKIERVHCIPSTTGIGASSKRKRVCSPLLSVFLCNRNFSSERESPFGFHLHRQK